MGPILILISIYLTIHKQSLQPISNIHSKVFPHIKLYLSPHISTNPTMKFSAPLIIATLAIAVQAAPAPAQAVDEHVLAPRFAPMAILEVAKIAANVISGFIDTIRQASAKAHLKQMAKKRKYLSKQSQAREGRGLTFKTEPTDAQKKEWMTCLNSYKTKGWFTETKCGVRFPPFPLQRMDD